MCSCKHIKQAIHILSTFFRISLLTYHTPHAMSSFWEILHDAWPAAPAFLPKDYPDLTGRYALITGCSAGIGYESAKLLLSKNATVVMVNRSKSRTEAAIEKMKHELVEQFPELTSDILDERIITKYLDLSDLTTIKEGIAGLESQVPRLDITIFNAGVMLPGVGSLSKQGFELQFGTNVVGHHLLLKFIHPLVLKADSPRVITLSSLAHRSAPANGGLTWDFKERDASAAGLAISYGQSKAACLYQAYTYGEMYKSQGVIALPVHPGVLQSDLWRNLPTIVEKLIKLASWKTIYGAYTELFAALSPTITVDNSGQYIGPWGEFRPIRADIKKGCTDGTAQKLWDYLDDAVAQYL